MHVVLVYATYSNSTFIASTLVAQELQKKGHTVDVVLAKEVQLPQLQNAELIILASPSWDLNGEEGMMHEDFNLFANMVGANTFPGKKFAVVGLGDSSYTYFCGAVTHLEALVTKMQGTLVTESLRIDQFYMAEAENSQKVTQWAADLAQKLA